MDCIIGVDFDNTLVSYDVALYTEALQRNLIRPGTSKYKQDIRDRIRELPGGEIEWRKLQGIMYGLRMEEARLIDGVEEVFGFCKQNRFKVYIVSHKSIHADQDSTRTNLRTAAFNWMEKNSFFEPDGLGLSRRDVYFESTRGEKVERIKALGCTHFIDDLEEIFMEPSFPQAVTKLLYAPRSRGLSLPDVLVFGNWKEIQSYLSNGIHR